MLSKIIEHHLLAANIRHLMKNTIIMLSQYGC